MANFVYTPAKSKFLSADLDLNSHDIRVGIVMTNTTADTEQDACAAVFGSAPHVHAASMSRLRRIGNAYRGARRATTREPA